MRDDNDMNAVTLSRRSFLKGAVAFGALASAGGLLAACSSSGQGAGASGNGSSNAGSDSAASDTSSASDAPAASAGTALVVYYSATGNTERVAQAISDALGADIFEIEPSQPYTDEDLNWRNEGSRVCVEHDNPDDRHVELQQAQIPDFDTYETVFFGYPIWWQQAAWPVDDVVRQNDFTGKTVHPFATSTSSPIGSSGENLAAMAGAGDWQEGRRFSSGASNEDVASWLDELGL